MRTFKREHIPAPRSDILAPSGVFDLEIGCGAGLHPILYTKQNPSRKLVAIERTKEKFEKFYGRYIRHGSPQNLTPIHDDALSWVTHRVEESSIERVFILYPNPEPGNKNQRFAHMPFTDFLVSRLCPSGQINFATNIESYAQELIKNLGALGLELVSNGPPELPGRTHFERKYLERGEACYDLLFQKK